MSQILQTQSMNNMYMFTSRKRTAVGDIDMMVMSKRLRSQPMAPERFQPSQEPTRTSLPWWKKKQSTTSTKRCKKHNTDEDSIVRCQHCVNYEAEATCNRCEKDICEGCTRNCDSCNTVYCNLCVIADYNGPVERRLCFGCNEYLLEDLWGKERRLDDDGDEQMRCR